MSLLLLLFFRKLFGLYTYRSTNFNVMCVSFSTLSWVHQTLVFCSTFRKRRNKALLIFFLFLNSKNFPPIIAPYSSFYLLVPRRLFKCSQKIRTALYCAFALWIVRVPSLLCCHFSCLMTNRPASGINPTHQHQTLLGWPWGQLFRSDSNFCTDLHITEAKLNVRGYINIAVQLDWKCTKVTKWKNELPNNIYLPRCWCIMTLISN